MNFRSALANSLLVGCGGFLGSLLRYWLVTLVHRIAPMAVFPHGTLAVNLLGCFAIGALAGLADSRQALSPPLRVFIFIGVLGGFTTFSAFGYETFALARDGDYLRAGGNVALHVVLGLGLLWLAYGLASVRWTA